MAELANVQRNGIRQSDRTPSTIGASPVSSLFGWNPFQMFDGFGTLGISYGRGETGYDFEIPVPGFAPDQVELSYHDGVLQVSCKSDRRQMQRSLVLPDDADPEKVEARVVDGLLTVHVERYEQAKPRKIAIKSS